MRKLEEEEKSPPYLGDELLEEPPRGSSRFGDEPRASVLFVLTDCAELKGNADRLYSTPDKYLDKCIESWTCY